MQWYTTADTPANLSKYSFTAKLMEIGPNGQAPIFGMTGLAKTRYIDAKLHSYWTKTMQFPHTTLGAATLVEGALPDDETTLAVADSSYFKPNSVISARKKSGTTFLAPEFMLVVAINSATSIEVVRGFAGTTARGDFALGQNLIEISNAYEEGSEKPISRVIKPEEIINRVQIYRDGWDVTGTNAAIKQYVGDGAMAENKNDARFFHAQSIEKNIIFGRKSSSIYNGRPMSTMDGIVPVIEEHAPANIHVAGTTTSYKQLEAMVNPTFDYSVNNVMGNTKMIFCGGNARTVINDIGRLSGQYTLVEDATVFGLRFNRFKTSRGDFELVEHPMFNTNPEWKGAALVFDSAHFDLLYLRETFHKEYYTEGRDATGGAFTTECTTELRNPMACAFIHDLTEGVA
jgi:hypothetical protein